MHNKKVIFFVRKNALFREDHHRVSRRNVGGYAMGICTQNITVVNCIIMLEIERDGYLKIQFLL